MIKKIINKDLIDKSQTFIQVESSRLKQPGFISLELFEELMKESNNINLFEFNNQDASITKNPDIKSLKNLDLSIDENYLYIWMNTKWKRIALLDY